MNTHSHYNLHVVSFQSFQTLMSVGSTLTTVLTVALTLLDPIRVAVEVDIAWQPMDEPVKV